MSNKKGKIITIFSTKGGVGKTIFTINLAAAYQLLEKKVLIIDLDLYSGGIGLVLNVDENKDIYNFIDDINNKRYTEFKNYIAKYNDYIDVLCCPPPPPPPVLFFPETAIVVSLAPFPPPPNPPGKTLEEESSLPIPPPPPGP